MRKSRFIGISITACYAAICIAASSLAADQHSDMKFTVMMVNEVLPTKLQECELRVATFLVKPKGHGDWRACLDQASESVKPRVDAARSALANNQTAKSDFEQEAAYFDASLIDLYPRDYESHVEYQRRMDNRIDNLRDLGAKVWADVQ